MIEYCKKCGRAIIEETNIGTKKEPRWIKDCVRGQGNDVFCRYCSSTCLFIDGNMYSSEEATKLKKKEVKKK